MPDTRTRFLVQLSTRGAKRLDCDEVERMILYLGGRRIDEGFVFNTEGLRDEALTYITAKATDTFDDFTSRFGRPFGAKLFLKDNGRHGFEFLKREGTGGKKTTRKKTTRKKTTRKKAARKQGARKKGVAKKAARKSATRKSSTKT